MQKTQQMEQRTRDRLSESDTGQALLALIDSHSGSPAELARALGVTGNVMGQWIRQAKASKRGALLAEEKIGVAKELIRPDVPAHAWTMKMPGPVPGKAFRAKTEDARLLVRLAKKYGSAKAVCEAAGIQGNQYRNWKSRGRIPSAYIARMVALDSIDKVSLTMG